jgi:hypothetical protein
MVVNGVTFELLVTRVMRERERERERENSGKLLVKWEKLLVKKKKKK